MKVFYLSDADQHKNLGDNLTRPILEWLGLKVEYTKDRNEQGKFVGVGSVMSTVRQGDVVWGTGIMRENQNLSKNIGAKILAVRGKKTRKKLLDVGINCPEVYGDPSLLLPLIYNPDIEPIYECGYVRHYIDRDLPVPDGMIDINIQTLDWKSFVDQIKQCRKIKSSSLHGLAIAEAYGIPAVWVKGSDRIIGGKFKFLDYITGTGRKPQDYGELPPIPNLKEIQDDLLNAIKVIK